MTTITSLPLGQSVADTDLYAAVDATDFSASYLGTTKKYSMLQLKNYIQLQADSSNIRSAKVVSTSALDAVYTNGDGGIGARLTNSGAFLPLEIDAVALSIGDRVLVTAQSDAAHNGVYTVLNPGSISTPWIMVRSLDYNGSLPLQIRQGDFILVFSGSQNALKFWAMVSPNPIVVGTSNIYFEQQEFRQSWDYVTSTLQELTPNQGYIVASNSLCTMTLPEFASVGDTINIQGKGIGLFKIAQLSGQQIFFGSVNTTLGDTGYIQSTHARDSITLICTAENVEWTIFNSNGNLEYF